MHPRRPAGITRPNQAPRPPRLPNAGRGAPASGGLSTRKLPSELEPARKAPNFHRRNTSPKPLDELPEPLSDCNSNPAPPWLKHKGHVRNRSWDAAHLPTSLIALASCQRRLTRISHHAWPLLGDCRKGGALAPPKPRLPPCFRPVPRAACGRKLRGARDTVIIRKDLSRRG